MTGNRSRVCIFHHSLDPVLVALCHESIRFVNDQEPQVVQMKARCIVHVIDQATGSADENVKGTRVNRCPPIALASYPESQCNVSWIQFQLFFRLSFQ